MAVDLDPNRGPLTLHHDTTPRDIGKGPAPALIWQDFRFKGFPDRSFQAPKIPKYKRMSLDLMNAEKEDQYFGKTTHFDTARNQQQQEPKHLDRGAPHVDETKIQYPVRDPLGQLTEEHRYKLQREMRDIEEDKKQRDIIEKLRTEERQEEKRKVDNRKHKFLETDLDPSPPPSYRERMHSCLHQPNYLSLIDFMGTPGGGAPLRTKSGKIKTSVTGDILIRFQEKDRKTVEERYRYNQDREEKERYHQDLERQRNEQELRKQEDRLDNLQKELETLKGDQYGKPGGGAPNRSNTGGIITKRKMYHAWGTLELLRIQARKSFTERREKDTWDPWGQGAGNPNRDQEGRVKPRPKALNKEKKKPMPSIESPRRGNWTAPPTYRYDHFGDDIGRSMNHADRLTHVNREVLPLYHPFGRAGGGAPMTDARGKIVTQIQGNLKMESTYDEKARQRARARDYYDFLKGQEEEQRRNKQEIEWHMKAPIGEMASIMGSKYVGKPVKDPYTGEYRNHHLGNSDVTLQKMNYQPKAATEKKKYHEDLSQLADERMRYRQLNRLKDNQEGMLHHHTMDAMWGRPGGGAPKGYNLRKFNLESTLHHPTKDVRYHNIII